MGPLPDSAGRGALRGPTVFHRTLRILARNLFEDVEECERERQGPHVLRESVGISPLPHRICVLRSPC